MNRPSLLRTAWPPARRWLAACAAIVLASAAACTSISDSITSPSASVSASIEAIAGALGAASDSLSRSSGGGSSHSLDLYARDVSAYTVAVLREGAGEADFLRGLGRLARQHGYSRWEDEPATLSAIGRGLALAGANEAQLEAAGARLAAHAPQLAARLRAGWESAARGG